MITFVSQIAPPVDAGEHAGSCRPWLRSRSRTSRAACRDVQAAQHDHEQQASSLAHAATPGGSAFRAWRRCRMTNEERERPGTTNATGRTTRSGSSRLQDDRDEEGDQHRPGKLAVVGPAATRERRRPVRRRPRRRTHGWDSSSRSQKRTGGGSVGLVTSPVLSVARRDQSNSSASDSRMAAQHRSVIATNISSPRSVRVAYIAPSTVMSGPWNRPYR